MSSNGQTKREWQLPDLSEHLLLADTPLAVIDLETTGLDPKLDGVIELGVVGLAADGSVEFEFETLVRPHCPVGLSNQVHGLSDADLSTAPTFAEAAPALAQALSGRLLAGHNLYYFDLRFLRGEFRRLGHYFPFAAATDTMRVGSTPFTSLDDVCAKWGVPRAGDHTALGDARTCAALFSLWMSQARKRGVTSWADFKVRGELFDASNLKLDPSTAQLCPRVV